MSTIKIEKIWDFGYVKTERDVEPVIAGYGIEILWDNGDRDSFRNTDVNEVKIKAFDLILKKYKQL